MKEMGRERHIGALNKMFRGKFNRGICLHPNAGSNECDKGIVNAHTVQRAKILESISEAGHVYQFEIPPNLKQREFRLKRIGINEATTFRGFCGHHDSLLFKPLEASPFTFSQEQLFLLGYRALCRDYYTKSAERELLQELRVYVASHSDLDNDETDEYLRSYQLGTKHGLAALEHHKKIFDKSLLTGSFTNYRSCSFVFSGSPVCFCAGAFAPEYDFDGNLLQYLGNLTFIQDTIAFSLWAAGDSATAIFVWHESSEKQCRRFIESLKSKPPTRIGNLVISLAFEHCENTAFSPNWWDALSPRNKNMLRNRLASGLPSTGRRPSCLKDDGNTLVNWRAVKVVES